MPRSQVDTENCRRRSRLAARKGVEAVPVRLYAAAGPATIAAVPAGLVLASAQGTLPSSEAERVGRINAALAHQGLEPLRADQVLTHTMEAGSSSFIASRSMTLHGSTLRNVARGAVPGFAFMNSHRTGGLSSPAEQPYGRTFAGRYEQYRGDDGRTWARSLVSFYMLRGVRPNGDSGPSTDDLSAGIDAGTVFDVSLGLSGGRPVCDVCGHGFDETDREGRLLCLHVPGTTRRMDEQQIKSQKRKGVPDGVATYSLVDAHPSEVSAVYNGAVPGAGFTRALSFGRAGLLGPAHLSEARRSYRHLLAEGRTTPFHPRGAPMTWREMLARLGLSGADADDLDLDSEFVATGAEGEPAPAPVRLKARPDPAVEAMRKELAEQRKLLEASNQALKEAEQRRKDDERAAKVREFALKAEQFCEKHKDRLTGQTRGVALAVLGRAASADLDHPVEGFSFFDKVCELIAGSAPPGLTRQSVGNGPPAADPEPREGGPTFVLSGDRDGYDPVAAARRQNEEFLGPPRRTA